MMYVTVIVAMMPDLAAFIRLHVAEYNSGGKIQRNSRGDQFNGITRTNHPATGRGRS